MSDSEANVKNKAETASPEAAESIDDILAGIINKDGSFNDEFNGLFSRYLGENSQQFFSASSLDISDRSDDAYVGQRVEYEDPEVPFKQTDSIEQRIEDKLPEEIRDIYADEAADAQRPEFTSGGDVRYPAMGVGAAEERVVYDADWEEKARKEAARLQRVREDRMLRGDSAYARSFVAKGRPLMVDPLSEPGKRRINPAYIDPLSDDDDFMPQTIYSRGAAQGGKQPFFQGGFSANQVKNNAAGGKTQTSLRDGKKSLSEEKESSKPDWLQVADNTTGKKKRRFLSKRKIDTVIGTKHELTPIIPDWVPEEKAQENEEKQQKPDFSLKFKAKKYEVDYTAVLQAESEAKDLRYTVAEIVDKYNKRKAEEQARREKEEAQRREEERKRAEAEEFERQEREKRRAGVSGDIISFLFDEELNHDEEYDDFSLDAYPPHLEKKELDSDEKAVLPNEKKELEKLDTAEKAEAGLKLAVESGLLERLDATEGEAEISDEAQAPEMPLVTATLKTEIKIADESELLEKLDASQDAEVKNKSAGGDEALESYEKTQSAESEIAGADADTDDDFDDFEEL